MFLGERFIKTVIDKMDNLYILYFELTITITEV